MITRADVVVRRTYARPYDDDETRFETWNEICERVALHQQWLWERAKGSRVTGAVEWCYVRLDYAIR